MANALSERFEALAAESDVQGLIDDERAEDLHIEFKRKANRATPKPDRGDYNEFSKALSGFANSAGGILLWGVGTTKVDGRDVATEREPIVEHVSFASRLQDGLLAAVEPSIDGVRIEPIASIDARVGYVKCLVPPSDRLPHRASADHEYYKRSGDDFCKLEHFDLADMFGRRPQPRLSVSFRVVQNGSISSAGEQSFKGLLIALIRNEGRGSAKNPYFAVTIPPGTGFANLRLVGRDDGMTRHTTSEERRTIFTSSSLVLHPDVEHEVIVLNVSASAYQGAPRRPGDVHISYELSADDSPLQRREALVPGSEIAQALFPTNLLDKLST